MSGLTKIDDQGKAIEGSPSNKLAKRNQKEEATGLIQKVFKNGYESPMAAALADAYAAGVVLGVKEKITPLVQDATGFGFASDESNWTDAIATLPKSTADCDWWETV